MFSYDKTLLACFLSIILFTLLLPPLCFSQDEPNDEQIIERYKLMLNRKPREGSTFDRVYQFYLEGTGLDAMVTDYQSEAKAKPNDSNIQLILGHVYKRLGRDKDALTAYQRAVELSQNDYYAHFALGQFYVLLRQHEDAITELTQAATLSEKTQTISPEELTEIYKSLGQAYFSRDMLDEAVEAWQKIAALDPNDIFARIELADLFREQELYSQAIAQYQAIIEIKKDDTYRRCLSLREIGKIYEESGDDQKALKNYDEALELTAAGNWLRKDLQQRIIAIYSADANWKDLIAYYKAKLETNPNAPELLGLLAAAYIENQQLEEGIDTYRKGLELAPTDTGLRISLISTLRNAEKFAEAAAEYEVLSEQQPDDFGIYRELGKLYLQLEDGEKAKAVYKRMIDRDPESANTYITLAEIYAGHEWLDDAIDAYQKALSLDPDNLDYIEYYGEFYYRQGNRVKAIEIWNRMVADTKNIAENYDRLARLLDTKKFSDEAIEASRKAVELMPTTYRFREALAKRLMNNGQYEDALSEYTEAIKLAPNDFFAEQMDDKRIDLYKRQGTLTQKIEEIETHLGEPGLVETDKFTHQKRLAKMYLKLGNTTYAIKILLEAKELQPNDINVNRWAAEVYVKQGRTDEAIPIYRHLSQIDATNAREYYANIANLYLQTMKYEEATAAAKQVITHSPRHPEGHQLLAQIALQSGDYESAAVSYKQAIRLKPEAIDIRKELANLYHISGNFRLAIAQYWRCWTLSNDVSDKLNLIAPLGEAYYKLGRREELAERLKQMAKSNTSAIAPVLALAQVHRSEGDLSSARFQLARALDQQRDNPELLYQLVGISLDIGDIDEALTYQQRLVKADPDPFHLQKLGQILFDVGREQEAVQTWSKVLHQKKHTLDAQIRLAKLLIRHGLLEEALYALDNAAEKITGADAHSGLYQIGATLVEINEPEKALSYFQRIIEMSKPAPDTKTSTTKKTQSRTQNSFYGPPGINTNKLHLASILANRVRPQSYSVRSVTPWVPSTFEESQAAALVQLRNISDDLGKLDDLFNQFEEKVTENPKDIHNLELLTQLYILTDNQDKINETLDKLIVSSQENLVYQGIKLRLLATQDTFSYDTFTEHLEKMTGLSTDAENWFLVEYANVFINQGDKDDATSILNRLEGINVVNISNGNKIIDLFVRMGQAEKAEEILSKLPATAAAKHSYQYGRIYESVTNTYLNQRNFEKAVEYFWKSIEKTNPATPNTSQVASLTSSTYYSGSHSYQTNFPSPTAYFSQTRLDSLQKFFNKIWISEQQELLFKTLDSKYNAAEGRARIYPALARIYCNWWDGKRDKALQALQDLQAEFPDDLTLRLNTIFVSMQSGKHDIALDVLKELIDADPKNLVQYYDLTLHIAMYTGNSSVVRELMKKLLNSPTSAQQLYTFSQKLQTSGFTQFAVAVSQKATDLAMTERDPAFLRKFSQHLNDLGRGQDAARLVQRAVRLENLQVLSGQRLPVWNTQSMTIPPKQLKLMQEREAKLVKIAEENPTSFKAQSNLASFYSRRNQVQKAIKAYEAALEIRPNDGTLRSRLADLLRSTGQSKKAVAQYIHILKNSLSSAQYGYHNYDFIIETFIQAGEMNELISAAKEIIQNGQKYGRGNEFVHRVLNHFQRNNNAKAIIEIYEAMLAAGDDYAAQNLVSAYTTIGNTEKALKLLRDRLKAGSVENQVQTILRLSRFNEGLDDIEGLMAEYEEKLTVDTVEPSMLFLLSILKITTNDMEGSDVYVDKLLQDDNASNRIYWLETIARTYQEKADSDRQLRVLEKVVKNADLQNTSQLANTYQTLGGLYAEKGEKEKAQKAYRKMGNLRLMRSGGPSYYYKESVARIYMEQEMYDEAEVLLIEVVNDLSAQNYYRERAQEQLATIRIKRDGVDASTELKNPMEDMNIALLRTKAQEHRNRRNFYEAIKVYEQIVKRVPDDLSSQAALASLYTEQNQHDKAIETWNELLKIDPENTKYQDGVVNAHKKANRTDEAITLAKIYIQENPDVGLNHTRLADLYVADGQIDAAIKTYKKAIELLPNDAKSYEELGKLYTANQDYDAAEIAYDNALKNSAPGSSQTMIKQSLMQIYEKQGRLDEVMKQAEEQGTLSYEMQRERARIYQENGEMENAISAYQKALGMTSDRYARADIQRQLISIYSNTGKLEEYLKEAEEQGSVSFEMQKEIAKIYQNKREFEKAANAYKKALQMTTQHHERYQLEREMMRSIRQSGKFEQFVKDMEKDGTLTTELQIELGEYYSSRGQSKKAIAAFEKASNMTNSTSDQEEVSSHLMREYVRIGNTDKSIAIYERLIQTAAENQSIHYYSGSSGFGMTTAVERTRESLINSFKQTKKLNELENIYKTKLEEDPKNAKHLILLAEIQRGSANHQKAAELYQTLMAVQPDNAEHYYYAAASLFRTGQEEQAKILVDQGKKALSDGTKNKETMLLTKLGSICYQSKMYNPAIELYKEVAKLNELTGINSNNTWQQERVYEILGKLYHETEQYEAAVEAYQKMAKITTSNYTKEQAEKGIKLAYDEGNLHEKQIPKQIEKVKQNPNDVHARNTLAHSYVLSERFDEAIVQYEKLSELEPDTVAWQETLADLYQKSTQMDKSEQFKKAVAAYEKAIKLDPKSYELYDLLAKLYVKNGDVSKAETTYLKALDASQNPNEHDRIVTSILELHKTKSQLEKRLEILEVINEKQHQSILLHKTLGDAYLASGDTDKARLSYKKWLDILKNESNEKNRNNASELYQLAEQLLSTNRMPDIALQAAKQAAQLRPDSTYSITLGNAYLINDQHEKAFEQFERSFSLMNQSGGFQNNRVEPLLRRISQVSKNIKDNARYLELMGKLVDAIPDSLATEINTNILLSEFCRELGMTDKAKTLILKTGFFPETAWLTLGPFDNTKGVGYSTAFIPEEEIQIDMSKEYDGAAGKIKWSKGSDEIYDGFFEFGKEEAFYAAYAWISFTSPEEREAEIRFDSDDQGKVWLNGKKVYAHRRTRGAQIDRRTIPITLSAGDNTILVKVCNQSLPWGFYLRITDTDGNPFEDLTVKNHE